MTAHTRAGWIVVGIGVALFASACGSAGAGGSAPTSSAALAPVSTMTAPTHSSSQASGWFATNAPTTGPSSTPEGPLPSGVDAASFTHDAQGAETFARTYLAAVDKALTTADPSWLNGWSSSSCTACTEQLEKVTTTQTRKWQVRPAHVTRADLVAVGGLRGQYVVQGPVRYESFSLVDASGSTVQTQPARSDSLQFVVSWIDGRWVIGAQNAVPPPSR